MFLSLGGKGEGEVKTKDRRDIVSGMGILGSSKGRRRAGLRSVQLIE
jgi:hypothetical protein